MSPTQSLLATALAAALLGLPLAAQETAAPRVSLGFAAGPPGKQITVPILLDGATGKKIDRVVSEVKFPAQSLSFIRLERAALLAADAFDAFAEVRGESGDARARKGEATATPPEPGIQLLEVRISSKQAGRALQDGIVGYLVFQIQPATSPEKTPGIVLAHESRLFAAGGNTDVPLAVVSDETKLVVEKPGLPVISCFFYMH